MKFVYITLSAFILVVNSLCIKLPRTQDIFNIFEWKAHEFNWGYHPAVLNAIPAYAAPVDVQPADSKGNIVAFITTPKVTADIPFTLARIEDQTNVTGPTLLPYPRYDWHNYSPRIYCDKITSAYRLALNSCNQMWVIDSGVIDFILVCPPQLLLFDLNTDKLIHRYRFDDTLYTRESLFTNLVVNVRDSDPRSACKNTMVYVADTKDPGFVVYDMQRKSASRFKNPDPFQRSVLLTTESFSLLNGIGMVTDKTYLYFHSFANVNEYKIPLAVIDNSTLAMQNVHTVDKYFQFVGARKMKCTASAIDSRKTIYCFTTNPTTLTAWNIADPVPNQRIIELPVNNECIHFVSGLKVVKNIYNQETLIILSHKLQPTANGIPNPMENKFYILSMPILDTAS